MEDSNRSSNPSIHDVSEPTRRTLLRRRTAAPRSLGAAGAARWPAARPARWPADRCSASSACPSPPPTRSSCPRATSPQVIAAWGEPVGLSGDNPGFKDDGTNTAAEQEAQMGMHHDGIHFYRAGGQPAAACW